MTNKKQTTSLKKLILIILLVSLFGISLFFAIKSGMEYYSDKSSEEKLDSKEDIPKVEEELEASIEEDAVLDDNSETEEPIRFDILDYSESIGLTIEEFIKQEGNPNKREESYDNYLEDNITKLSYNFGEVTFIALENKETFLVAIDINNSDIEGPSGIKVGKEIESIFEKFPKEHYETEYVKELFDDSLEKIFGPNTEVIHIYGVHIDGYVIDVGTISYNEDKQPISVEYRQDWETGGGTILRFEISNNKIRKIKLAVGYM